LAFTGGPLLAARSGPRSDRQSQPFLSRIPAYAAELINSGDVGEPYGSCVVGCLVLLSDDATRWYSSALFWGIVAALIALAGLYATWRAIPPRRTLYFWRSGEVQLVRSDSEASVDLEIRRNGNTLRDPHVVQVTLASRGRADIGPGAFNGPIVLDVGVPILEVLASTSDAQHIPAPPSEVEGGTLRIRPSLLGRRHNLTYSFLVEGAPTHPMTLDNRPQDVNVRASDLNTTQKRILIAVGLGIAGLLNALMVAGFILLQIYVLFRLISVER
jgi:hypothetical protein